MNICSGIATVYSRIVYTLFHTINTYCFLVHILQIIMLYCDIYIGIVTHIRKHVVAWTFAGSFTSQKQKLTASLLVIVFNHV